MFLFYHLKKIFLGIAILVMLYMGSSGAQSSSLFMQALSFILLLVTVGVIYVFLKMVLKGLGCLPSILIMGGIAFFMMYTFGMFSDGVAGSGEKFLKFIGRNTAVSAGEMNQDLQTVPAEVNPQDIEPSGNGQNNPNLFESFDDVPNVQEQNMPVRQQRMPEQITNSAGQSQGLFAKVAGMLSGQVAEEPARQLNPNEYPVIYGTARVINGDTLEMYGKYFKLYGIAAPEISQSCADARGTAYNCGREAALWLKSWIDGYELECHIIQQDTKGNMVGTCALGQYDLGAAIVNAGWALAYVKYTDIYFPYEKQAEQNRRGLWQGQFYKPWDWKKIKDRQSNVKVIKQKKKKAGIF